LSKLAIARSRSLSLIQQNRQTIRGVVSTTEIMGAAFASGYVEEMYPDGIGGVPVAAGAGIALLAAGHAMKQADMKALGIGMLAGYAHSYGRKMAAG
jgi:hypothetical protein